MNYISTPEQIRKATKKAIGDTQERKIFIGSTSEVHPAAEILKGTDIPVCSVAGFTLGAATTKTKVFEAKEAIENGAKVRWIPSR